MFEVSSIPAISYQCLDRIITSAKVLLKANNLPHLPEFCQIGPSQVRLLTGWPLIAFALKTSI